VGPLQSKPTFGRQGEPGQEKTQGGPEALATEGPGREVFTPWSDQVPSIPQEGIPVPARPSHPACVLSLEASAEVTDSGSQGGQGKARLVIDFDPGIRTGRKVHLKP